MMLKRKLAGLGLLAVFTCLVGFFLPRNPGVVPGYDQCIFYPFQAFRCWLLGAVPFSAGDVAYVLGGVWLLVTVINWVRYCFRFRTEKWLLASSVINTVCAILLVYLFFIFGWGANYYKPSLVQSWRLIPPRAAARDDSAIAERKKRALANLVVFNHFLTGRLNSYAPYYKPLRTSEINNRAKAFYAAYTDTRLKPYGLQIKPSFFGYFMQRLGVEGYYNPFTGEGQVDESLPAFTMPFLICHEMAHQAGTGSEEDANLIAYALCTAAPDPEFRYSAYLNVWLYAFNRLYRRDSVAALNEEHSLNKLTLAHLDTLDQLSRKYQNQYARYSSELYDSYLKMQDQKEGTRSYGNVVTSAWLLEERRKEGTFGLIHIP